MRDNIDQGGLKRDNTDQGGSKRHNDMSKEFQTRKLQLSERLASRGIMGAQLRAPQKSPVHHSTIIV